MHNPRDDGGCRQDEHAPRSPGMALAASHGNFHLGHGADGAHGERALRAYPPNTSGRGDGDRIALGEEAGGYRDEGFNFLQTLAQSTKFEDVRLVAAVDKCIAFLSEAWRLISAGTGREQATKSADLLQWLTWLLSERHLYVDAVVYAAISGRMRTACQRLRVVVSTSSQLIKVNGGVSYWAAFLAEHWRLLLLQDEFQLLSMEDVSASVAPFHAVVLLGDLMQARWNSPQ